MTGNQKDYKLGFPLYRRAKRSTDEVAEGACEKRPDKGAKHTGQITCKKMTYIIPSERRPLMNTP